MKSPEYSASAERTVEEVVEVFSRGVDAGYYHIDSPEERQPLTIVDFMSRTCGKCDFLVHGYCAVVEKRRDTADPACDLFGKEHEEAARQVIRDNREAQRQAFFKNPKFPPSPPGSPNNKT